MAECWLLNVSGISLSQYDGEFCLHANGCTLVDNNHANSWAVQIGSHSSTLTAGTYATYTLTGVFNCNGTNVFTLTSENTGSGWPSTISISPTNCPWRRASH